MNDDRSRIDPKVRIIVLAVLTVFELISVLAMLATANAVGLGNYLVDKGFVVTISKPVVFAILIVSLIYEACLFSGKCNNFRIRYILYVFAFAAIAGGTLWYAVHSPIGGNQILKPMRGNTELISVPLLEDISPKENAELESWINKNPLENDGHIVLNKSDLAARIISTQQDVPPFADPENSENNFADNNYYSTKLYLNCANEKVVRLLLNSWDDCNAQSQNGVLNNGVEYRISVNNGQHLIMWRGNNVLEVDYSGAANIKEFLQMYAKSVQEPPQEQE